MAKISIEHISLSYDLSAVGTEECLLFMHGLQSRKEIFSSLCKNLATAYNVPQLAIDFVGFGESDKPENFDYDLSKQEHIIRVVLKTLGIKKVHVIGHSLGGMVGTLMLDTMPDIVQSLVSLEGNLCFEDCSESRKVAKLSFDNFRQEYYPRLKETLKSSKEISAQFRLQSLDIIPDYVFYRTSQTIVDWSKSGCLLNAFENAKKPKLMVCGSKSSFQSRTGLGGATSCEIPDAGHFMLLDRPDVTAVAVANFLKPMLSKAY